MRVDRINGIISFKNSQPIKSKVKNEETVEGDTFVKSKVDYDKKNETYKKQHEEAQARFEAERKQKQKEWDSLLIKEQCYKSGK